MKRFIFYAIVSLFTFASGTIFTLFFVLQTPAPPISNRTNLTPNSVQCLINKDFLKKTNNPAKNDPVNEVKFPRLWEEAETAAGKLQIVEFDFLEWEVLLNGKVILSDVDRTPPHIAKHIKIYIKPFEETLILQTADGTYCNSGRFWFLGVKRDKSFKLSKGIGDCFAEEPTISSGKNFTKVKIRSGYGNNHLKGEPYLYGGTWIFNRGYVKKLK